MNDILSHMHKALVVPYQIFPSPIISNYFSHLERRLVGRKALILA